MRYFTSFFHTKYLRSSMYFMLKAALSSDQPQFKSLTAVPGWDWQLLYWTVQIWTSACKKNQKPKIKKQKMVKALK